MIHTEEFNSNCWIALNAYLNEVDRNSTYSAEAKEVARQIQGLLKEVEKGILSK